MATPYSVKLSTKELITRLKAANVSNLNMTRQVIGETVTDCEGLKL
jgi:hypothetical protein